MKVRLTHFDGKILIVALLDDNDFVKAHLEVGNLSSFPLERCKNHIFLFEEEGFVNIFLARRTYEAFSEWIVRDEVKKAQRI